MPWFPTRVSFRFLDLYSNRLVALFDLARHIEHPPSMRFHDRTNDDTQNGWIVTVFPFLGMIIIQSQLVPSTLHGYLRNKSLSKILLIMITSLSPVSHYGLYGLSQGAAWAFVLAIDFLVLLGWLSALSTVALLWPYSSKLPSNMLHEPIHLCLFPSRSRLKTACSGLFAWNRR